MTCNPEAGLPVEPVAAAIRLWVRVGDERRSQVTAGAGISK
jgi:hypothetical protein